MDFVVKEHGGITPEVCDRPFFLKHFAAYRFIKDMIKDKRVLEIGFGTGYGSNYLAEFASEIIAVDLFEKNVNAAQEKWERSNLNFQTMDACKLDFKDREFDVVFAFQLIEHIPRELHNTFFENVKRVLSDKGKLVLTTPNLETLKKKNTKYEKNVHHDLEFTPREFEDTLKAEFNNVEIFSVNYSFRQKMFILLKKSGVFKYLPNKINLVKRYFDNMPEEDFVVQKDVPLKAPDILAVVSN